MQDAVQTNVEVLEAYSFMGLLAAEGQIPNAVSAPLKGEGNGIPADRRFQGTLNALGTIRDAQAAAA